jgi:ribosome-binding protein aMBF1 (putative translation factor)
MPKSQHAAIYRKVPAFLREVRERSGISQRELGRRLKKTQSYVFKCEAAFRRVDVAEFLEWTLACGADAVEVYKEFAQLRQRPRS